MAPFFLYLFGIQNKCLIKKIKKMKKFFLVAVMSLGSLTAFAQDTETAVEAEVATEAVTEAATDAAATMEAQDEFTAIELSALPETITEALARDYPNAEISQAYVNEESKYKLEVTAEDGSDLQLYADADGNWLEM